VKRLVMVPACEVVPSDERFLDDLIRGETTVRETCNGRGGGRGQEGALDGITS
jgi:hypothetical protein